jgi:hypothetical protein
MAEYCWPLASLGRRRKKNGMVMDLARIGAVSQVVRHFEAREGIRGKRIEN